MSFRKVPNTDDHLAQLESGDSYRFDGWPNDAMPRVAAGVYTVWQQDRLIYAGMAGRGLSEEEIRDRLTGDSKKKGIFRRLASHASGRRGGDQFCIYVCDRFVVPKLTKAQQQQIGEGQLSLDQMTRDFIRRSFSYRFVVVDPSEVLGLERKIREGAMKAGLPYLNPLKRKKSVGYASNCPFQVVSERLETLELPSSGSVEILHRLISFPRWDGPQPGSDWNGKPVIGPPNRPFAELAILSSLESQGWRGGWVYQPGKLLNSWEPQKLVQIPGEVREIHQRIQDSSGQKSGCWDLLCWRGKQVVFAESKWLEPPDWIRPAQLRWLEAALSCGLPSESLTVYECKMNSPIP